MRRSTEGVVAPEPSGPARLWGPGWSVEAVIRLLEPLAEAARAERLRDVTARRLASVTVLLDAPHDPHNAAAVLRSCDAFGVGTLHVVPLAEPFLLATSVSRGSERWVDVLQHSSAGTAARWLRDRGHDLVACDAGGELAPEDLAALARPALLFGNEHGGLSPELRLAASRSVRIPMRGFVESLNVSVSAAILLSAATAGRPGDLPPEAQRLLYARGLFRSVARAGEILSAYSSSCTPSSTTRSGGIPK